MNMLVKVLLGLALVLPMTAYVVGSLVASADAPAPRETLVIEPSGGPNDDRRRGADRERDTPDGRKDAARPSPSATPDDGPADDGPQDDRDDGRRMEDQREDDREGDDSDDDRVDTVELELEDLDDDSGHGGDDDSGHGGDDDRDDDRGDSRDGDDD